MKRFPLLLTSLLFPILAVAKAGVADVAGEDPVLLIAMMILLLAFLGAVAVGMMLLICLIAIAGIMTALGLMSVASIVAWRHRSVARGLKVLIYLVFAAAGLAGGFLASCVQQLRVDIHGTIVPWTWIICGTSIAGGLLMARISLYMGRLLVQRIRKKTGNRHAA